ncbi:hypothetical protein [Jannaschia sp. 2305UL9-9]|uniref:hypothetical protein n=1 Tax=Jannaschia sp. 2305UL9-9 TaxID=3121638 RepID=UPI003527A2D8
MHLGQIVSFLVLTALPFTASAQDGSDGGTDPSLSISLDSLTQIEGTCRLTFVAENGTGSDIGQLVLEAVAFGSDGGVARLSLFDFRELPAGVPRVRQFDLPQMACGDVGSMLVNGVQTCEGTADCADALTVSSRADIELLG